MKQQGKIAIIGHTGFVGTNLCQQIDFKFKYNTKNIDDIVEEEFEKVYCAAPSAVKWKANKFPLEDDKHVTRLIDVIRKVKTDKFILLSTIDVYSDPNHVDEDSSLGSASDTYGRNRAKIEKTVEQLFEKHLVVRLPALYGEGLKKNYIFDLLNDNNLQKINLNSSFQWYDVSNLSFDLSILETSGVEKFNFAPKPILTEKIVKTYFPQKKDKCFFGNKLSYNVKTKYSKIFGRCDGYISGDEKFKNQFKQFLSQQTDIGVLK